MLFTSMFLKLVICTSSATGIFALVKKIGIVVVHQLFMVQSPVLLTAVLIHYSGIYEVGCHKYHKYTRPVFYTGITHLVILRSYNPLQQPTGRWQIFLYYKPKDFFCHTIFPFKHLIG